MDYSDADKEKLLKDMYSSIKGLPSSMSGIQVDLWKAAPESEKMKYNNQKKACEKMGIELLYNFGDAIEAHFNDNANICSISVDAWKQAVAVQQQYPYCGIDKTLPEKYLVKIQKKDATYTLPKKAGCISFR